MGLSEDLRKAMDNMGRIESTDKWDLSSDVLTIYEDCVIEGKCPIEPISSHLVICKGHNVKGTPKVIIRATGEYQPCIGHHTNTGLSYGRYEINTHNTLESIVIDNCDVYLESKVDNFTLGVFGKEGVPKIEIWSGSLHCPEMEGNRVMKIGPEPIQGSTKHSRYAQYIVIKDGETEEDYLPEEVKELKRQIAEITPSQAEYIRLKTSVKNIETALELLKVNNKLNCWLLLSGQYEHVSTHIIRTCCVLGLYHDCCINDEMSHEVRKWKCLRSKHNLDEDAGLDGLSKLVLEKIANSRSYDELTDFEKVMAYELIPIYLFDYSGKTDDECAREWWNTVGLK